MSCLQTSRRRSAWSREDPTRYACSALVARRRFRAGRPGRELISGPEHLIFLGAASVWRIRIKQGIGKLDLPEDFAEVLAAQPFEMLAVTVEHAHALRDLPRHHRDPFDRVLIPQARSNG